VLLYLQKKPTFAAPPEEGAAKTIKYMFDNVKTYLKKRLSESEMISDERKATLEKIAHWLKNASAKRSRSEILFVCIHNSRRSHLSEIHATAAVEWFGKSDKIKVYSGGTTVTAFSPNAAAAISGAGYTLDKGEGKNPVYKVRFSDDRPAISVWSKKHDDGSNPDAGFLAVMTCSDNEQNCPYIAAANARIPLYYPDPSEADDTPEAEATYDKVSADIARDLMYLFSKV